MWRELGLLGVLGVLGAMGREEIGLYRAEIKILGPLVRDSVGASDLVPQTPFYIPDGQCDAEVSQRLFQCPVAGLAVAVAESTGAPLVSALRDPDARRQPAVVVRRHSCAGRLRVDVALACRGPRALSARRRRAAGAPRALPPASRRTLT